MVTTKPTASPVAAEETPVAAEERCTCRLGAADLEARERSVLAELARDMDAWVTFQGLRRQLGLHQQALVRTLRRLERQGLVSRDERGYQLTDDGIGALCGGTPRAPSQLPAISLLHAVLPPHVSTGDVAAHLARRWFGELRWYGQSDGPGETSLHWMAGEARVTVRISGGTAQLEVEDVPTGQAKVFAAVRPLLQALAEVYGPAADSAS